MTAPPVLAEAVVRARDGRSVADWVPGGPEPAKAFVADPQRLHRAMALLDGFGLVVLGSGRCTVRFCGSAQDVHTAFAVTLVPGSGPDGPVWQVGSTPGKSSFDVVADGPFGSLLHRVHLRPAATPRARRPGEWELFVAEGGVVEDVHRDDFVLGETFATLVHSRHTPAGGPVPLYQPHPNGFPPANAAAALTQTRAAFADLVAPTGGRPETVLFRQVAARQQTGEVTAVIVETDADPGLENAFRGLLPDRDTAVPLTVTGVGDPLGYVHLRHFPEGIDQLWVVPFLEEMLPAWESAVAARMAFERTFPGSTASDDEERRRTFGVLHRAFAAFVKTTSPMLALPRQPDPWAGIPTLLDRIERAPTMLDAANLTDDGRGVWARLVDDWSNLRRWMEAGRTRFQAVARHARTSSQTHATMTAFAFLAVTTRLVPVEMRQVREAFTTGMRLRREDGNKDVRTVVSCSFGQPATQGLGSAAIGVDLGEMALIPPAERDRLVRVFPSGNADDTDVPDTIAAYAADRSHNVLVVGGCSPAGDHWEPCPRTHGYAITLPGVSTPVTLPHVCATTKATTGGSVLFPHPDVGRWWTGSGASLAVPIVAATCALVWRMCPGLPGDEVVAAVVAGADTLNRGSFTPGIRSAADFTITPGSESAAVNPARAALLAPALVAAAEAVGRRLSADPPQYLLPVRTTR